MANKQRITADISLRSFLYLLGALGVIALLWMISDILILLFASIVFAAALDPSVKALQRLKLPRVLAVALIYMLFAGVVIGTIFLIVPTVSAQIETISKNIPAYQEKLLQVVDKSPQLERMYIKLTSQASSISEGLISNAAPVAAGFFSGVVGFLTFLVLTFYMLSGGKRMATTAFDFIPQAHTKKRLINLSIAISTKLGYWLRGQAILGLIIFVASFIGLSFIGVEYALTLAVIAGIMELVPLVGAYLGAIPAVLVAATTSPSKGIAVAILFLVIQQLEGQVIVPQVMKRALGLPPIIILPAVLIGGKLLGFIGVLLAAPVAAAILVIIEDVLRQPDLTKE